MYVVAIFALALLSPLPFVSPFVYDVQNVEAQTPFGTSDQNNDVSSPVETSPQELNTFTLTSSTDNTNQSYAKAGDTITVTFTTDDILHYNATATINGRDASVSIFNNVLNASINVLETDPDGYINFEINVSSDLDKRSVSDADITTGNVAFVDKHVPVIKINGPPLVYVEQNDAYTDLGASVFDTDPNYPDDANSLSDNSSDIPLDTLGTYTIVYTAVNDGAGNEPFNKTRIVSVESSTVTPTITYVDTETIWLEFDRSAPAFYSGPVDLTSAVEVDGEDVISAIVPAQIRSITTLDNSLPALNFLEYGSKFGESIAHMGDLNQDGYEDIVVGIPQHSSLSNRGGAVAILHLGENAQSILDVFVHDGDSPNMPPLYQRAATHPFPIDLGEKFGASVENLGDINGDGFTDIAVGSTSRQFGDETRGVVYTIFLGANGSSVLGYGEINYTLENGPMYQKDSQFGHNIENMGDLNNDGINDIIVTAAETGVPPLTFGAAYIMHLGSDGLPIHTFTLNTTEIESNFTSLTKATDSRTWSVENMGDLNNDGFTDIMMATFYYVNKTHIGDNFFNVYYLGENGTSILEIHQIPMHGTNMPPPPPPSAKGPIPTNFGDAIQKLEDQNGDGYVDLLVSATTYLDDTDSNTGLFYVIFLGQGGTSALGYYEISGASISDLDLESEGFEFQYRSGIGTSFTVLGDINSDGGLEIVAGSTKFASIVHDGAFNGQGGVHVLSLAGPDDLVPHVVIKPNTTANTAPTSLITLDASSAKINLGTLFSDSSLGVADQSINDGIAPEIHDITMLSNTTLSIEFSESIETDTEFGLTSFRVSETDQHIAVTNVEKSSSNTVLLNVTRISSIDDPLVEILDSAIKDSNDNVLEYDNQTVPSQIGSYPLSAFWGYDYSYTDTDTGEYFPGPVAFILFEDYVEKPSLDYYLIDIPGDKIYTPSQQRSTPGYDQYHAVAYYYENPPVPFDYNQTGFTMTLAPKEVFLDSQNNAFAENYTLPIETFRPPKILSAETSEGRYIILTLDRYVTGVETSDFSISDSLSVQNVNISENKLILDVGSMQSDIEPTVTINGNITDKYENNWFNFVPHDIVIGTAIVAIDGSNPTILTAEYDNLYNLTLTYSEPINAATLDETDFETFYNIEPDIPDSNIKRITNVDTATDGLSSVLTFDKKINSDSDLMLVGSVYDKTGTAMIPTAIPLNDSTPPTMSSAKTITTTSIEIKFNENVVASTVYAGAFAISGGITVTDVTVLDDFVDVVFLTTTTIQEGATPTVTLRENTVNDRIGNELTADDTIVATDTIVPSLNSLSIISDNTNIGFAKSGDKITLQLVANEAVSFVSGTIFETELTQQHISDETSVGFSASVDIDDTTSNTNPTFAITIVDDEGNTKTVTQSDITGNTVIVDTLAPVITLIGSENTTLILDKSYADEGTVVIDNDPNYAGTSTLDVTNIDNTVLGNYTVTYSAPSDSAGNVPVTKTRNVEVVKLDPIPITSLTITSSSGDNFANASKIITLELEATSSDLGNFTGTMLGRSTVNTTTGGSATFQTTVLPGDTNGNVTFSITLTNSSGNEIQITNNNIIGGSFVTVDTIKPVINLNGNSPDTVYQGDDYLDQNGTVSDLNYLSSPTVTASPDNLITSSLGPQDITYSAPADAAGNVPDNVTRTVTVQAKPLGIGTLTIESGNTKNSSYAKTGDLITITLDTNGTIGSTTTTIASNPVTPTLTGNNLVAAYTVDSTFSEGSLGFSIAVTNEDNRLTSTFTETNLQGSSIIIDTIAPTIVLVNNNNTSVPTNSSKPYIDAGATASDASYASDLTVIGVNSDFDITKAGNYTFTYTAEDDAGNTATITRVVMVEDTPPIGIDSFEIESSVSGNELYAKAGDSLYFTLNVNNTIDINNVVANVPGANITHTLLRNNDDTILEIDAEILVTPEIESNATFTITIANENGTTLTVTKDDLTTPNVFVDTRSPRITPIGGSADYSIVNGTMNPIILGVNVTDGDPNHSGNYTLITPNGLVNANLNGSVYNYTYTADADSAGNLGDTLTRIITIIDADPIDITSLSIADTTGNPNFANLGTPITVTLVTDGTDLGNFTGTLLGENIVKNDVSSGTVTFTETVSSNDNEGNVTFSITMTNSSGNRIHITNDDIKDGSFVTIDTTKPVINLNGNSPDTVYQGDDYLDQNGTVSDINYLSSPTVTASPDNLDTSSLGPQDITYSAPADAAGNVPDDVTRTVTVQAKPLGIGTLEIESSNTKNSSYAKIGDLITITLDANGTINSATTIVASNTTTPTLTGNKLVAAYTVDSTFDEGSLGFSIAVTNEDNRLTSTFTETDLQGSSIIIDTIAPEIKLGGINNTIVPTDSSYDDAGATASDASYASDLTVTGANSDFDITKVGNYTFTYTAEDEAGNTATSTRVVMVQNIPPIGINSFEVDSNNTNPLYAKVGDGIFFDLNVNNTINFSNVVADVSGANAYNTESGTSNNVLYVDAAVLNTTVIESNATFTITIANENGTTLTVTNDDLTSPNVFIDTIPPRIAPDGGSNDYTILNGTTPVIRDVTVTDGDPKYSGNYTLVTPNGIVDTSVIGSVFNYTYTADADSAGNPGDSLTRIITIIDAEPITITSLSIADTTGNPNFANLGTPITVTLVTDGTDLGNFTGTLLGRDIVKNDVNSGTVTFTETVLPNDANENVTFSITMTNSTGNRIHITNDDIKDGSFVTIDTVFPTISLNGENDTVVALGEDYTYLGATAYDLSYGNSQVSTTDRVNVDRLGHYTLHYTAPTDAAGNVGPTIIRIVEVLDAPPIEITLFTIRNGGDSSSLYAKAGDDLSIQLSINYTIASYTATIFGIEQSESNQNSNGFLISQQVPYDLAIEEYASFSITIVDENGLPNTITQNTLITSSQLPPDNIFIDTISPTVTLSTQQISISVNGVLPNITATITEKDPNYGEKMIAIPGLNISASDDVDIGTVGAYPYTYTAPDDNAGNPGQSATISIVVKNATLIENRTTILSSTVIKDAPQSFSDDIIIAEIHNDDGDSNNTLSLDAPIVELDVSDITNTAPGANNYITTYTHPIDLMIHNTISAQIELGTVLEFNTADTTIRHNFTIHYVENDDRNVDVIRLGHTDINYELDTHAIGITFERVHTPFNVSITNDAGNYVPVESFEFTTTIENSANAWDILDDSTNSHYLGTLYTYDKAARTVTVWTSHLSDVRLNSTSSSGGDESDSNSPTLGKASSGAQLVTNGFEYNGLTVNVGRYHTEFPLIGTNVGDINTIKMKVYDSAGPSGVKRVEFALGVPDIGLYHEAEAFVEVWMQRDSVAVQETIIVDELNLLEDSDVSATVSQTSCSGGEQQCLLVELQYSYREPPAYNTISIKPVDWDNNAHQFYFNDGIHVDGDSINLPKEITISASHAADTTHAGETLHLVQIDRAEHLWVDQYGYQWKIIGNTVRQITVPEYLVPNDNTYGKLHGPDRNHPEFASSVYAEQQRAQETLAEILGHATIMKPLPESGGTIYFDATGTDSRSGDSFKLLLELETARMHQLSNLLYDDTS